MAAFPAGLRPRPSLAAPAERVDALHDRIMRLLPKLSLTVVHAGDSRADGAVLRPTATTRDWKSYETVARDIAAAADRLGCRRIDVAAEDMRLAQTLAGTDLAWLNTGGVQGRSCAAHAPSALEMLGVPYIGHEPLTAALLDNKAAFKRHAVAFGLPTAPFAVVARVSDRFAPGRHSGFRAAFGDADGPFVVKPVCGRASRHVQVADDVADLSGVVAEVGAASGGAVLVERFLPGREFCVAVGGRAVARGGRIARGDGPFVFSALERRLEPGERIFASMDQRPISAERARLVDPARDAETLAQLDALARRVWEAFGLEALVRLDVRADAAGRLHVLEVNPKPDLKAPGEGVASLVGLGLEREGMDYDDLILSQIANRIDIALSDRSAAHAGLARLIAETRA